MGVKETRLGWRYVAVGNNSRRGARHGGCSAPWGDTGLSFNFGAACQTHDLSYDLIRFFASRDGLVTTNVRRAVDNNFKADMRSNCVSRSTFARGRCTAWAGVYGAGVTLNSQNQGYYTP